jgi:hypothetical protein
MTEQVGAGRAQFRIDRDQAEANNLADALEKLAARVRERPPIAAEVGYERAADVVMSAEGAALKARLSNIVVEVQW